MKDRKRNTWYISERIAWVYMHIGKYEVAVKLLKNARAGYVVNTYAIALMLCGSENKARAERSPRRFPTQLIQPSVNTRMARKLLMQRKPLQRGRAFP